MTQVRDAHVAGVIHQECHSLRWTENMGWTGKWWKWEQRGLHKTICFYPKV